MRTKFAQTRYFHAGLLIIGAICSMAALAQTETAPRLELPVSCQIGADCLVQKLFDLQPGPGVRDFRCGRLTTEDHDGIDIRLRTLTDMARGYAVLAAAPGKVLRIRDGMADENVRLTGQESVKNRMAGNAVVIAHENGWESQYSHLRKGSIKVKPGDTVSAGTIIGLIGMSGNAEFPHLHFELRKNGIAVDPFLPIGSAAACSISETAVPTGLWSAQASRMLKYVPTAVIAAGFSAGPPEISKIRNQAAPLTELAADSEALVMWVDTFGVQADDEEYVKVNGPDGKILVDTHKVIGKSSLSWFSFTGKKKGATAWPMGRYQGHYQLMRSGKKIAEIYTAVSVK